MYNIIRVDLPDPNQETELWNLVSTYPIHRNSKTCRKYGNEKCRFHFGKYFTSHMIIAEPLPNDILNKLEVEAMEQRNKILKVKGYCHRVESIKKKSLLSSKGSRQRSN